MSVDRHTGSGEGMLGRIALKQVRMTRQEAAALAGGHGAGVAASGNGASTGASGSHAGGNPANRLVPYLDLFARLADDELARLALVEVEIVEHLRRQVDEICGALAAYADLLPRLADEELARLTGAHPKTIRFWRLCVGRHGAAAPAPVREPAERDGIAARGDDAPQVASPAEATARVAAPPAHAPAADDVAQAPQQVAASETDVDLSDEDADAGAQPDAITMRDDADIFADLFEDDEDDAALGKEPLVVAQSDDFF